MKDWFYFFINRMGEFRGTSNEDDAECGKDCSTDSYMDNSSNTNDDDYAECSLGGIMPPKKTRIFTGEKSLTIPPKIFVGCEIAPLTTRPLLQSQVCPHARRGAPPPPAEAASATAVPLPVPLSSQLFFLHLGESVVLLVTRMSAAAVSAGRPGAWDVSRRYRGRPARQRRYHHSHRHVTASFRLVVLGSRAIVQRFRPAFQTRDPFTICGGGGGKEGPVASGLGKKRRVAMQSDVP